MYFFGGEGGGGGVGRGAHMVDHILRSRADHTSEFET